VAVALRTLVAAYVSGIRRSRAKTTGLIVVVCAVLAAGLASATVASAAGTPSISQVQTKVNQLTSQYDQADQQYDQVETQLTAAKQRLAQLDKQLKSDQKLFAQAHAAVAQIASQAYEDSGSDSLAQLLTSSNPSQVLGEAAMIEEIAGQRNEQTVAYLDAAQALANVQQEQQDTEDGIQTLADQKASTRNHIGTLLNQEKATLDSLTEQQQSQISQQGQDGTTTGTYTGPTSTQADKAVEWAVDHLGCIYVFGGTGPCSSDTGYDCSGYVQAAWAFAGVDIPRDTYEQVAALPSIPEADIKPGDLLFYDGDGHVAIYLGNGMLADEPHTGAVAEEIPMDESWYAENFDSAAVP
jgi:cell wall-associated NlpC family hydrolase